MTKKISVLLPVYNAEPFLSRTLDSLLNQTYKNFEIIAINDGSTDDSLAILHKYAKQDSRIVIVDQENIGLVKTLNKAASIASGFYLARMDSDDLCLPRRFELQVEAFEKNKKAVLVGGCFDVMNEDDEILYRESVPTRNEELRRALAVRNPIAHGSAMFTKSAFEKSGGYNDDCGPTEDYELWSRFAFFGDIIGVPATIFRWRINPTGITQTKADAIDKYMKDNINNYLKRHELSVTKRAYLRKRGNFYITSYELHGIGMKEAMLKDCLGIAILFAKKGHYLKALQQVLAVASTGRTGVRLTFDRAIRTSKYHLSK